MEEERTGRANNGDRKGAQCNQYIRQFAFYQVCQCSTEMRAHSGDRSRTVAAGEVHRQAPRQRAGARAGRQCRLAPPPSRSW
jgi:hypothetical protein